MSVGMLFLVLVIGVLVIIGGIAVASKFTPDAQQSRKALQDAATERARARIATKALRAIANGAGNPIFEAQDALDQIESTYPKELN